jgi:hypothetical protein
MAVRLRYFTILTGRMIDGMLGWIEANSGVYSAGEVAFGGLDKEGLIAIIVISIIAIATFVWIFRELRKRD